METREQIAKQLYTIRDYMRWAVSLFHQADLYYGHGTDNPWDEALQLVLHALHLPPEIVPEILDARLTPEERQLLLVVFETRVVERIPAPYLTGRAWFAGLVFKVDERVIVPRSPIAELIENEFQPWVGDMQVSRILDMCTGCGCIGIASAAYMPQASVDLLDVSVEALEVATMNIAFHSLQDRVRVVQSDLFDQLQPQRDTYDVIVSNPPYVDARDLAVMPEEYHHEPALALEAGEDGLQLAKQILHEAVDYLNADGLLVLEVGNSGMNLEEQYPDVPFTWVEFARGGQGVMVLSREELLQYRDLFA